MTFQELNTMIAGIGLPYAFNHFDAETVPELPFILFDYPETRGANADDCNYKNIVSLDIILCSENKDFNNEITIDNILNGRDIPFYKHTEWIPDEGIYQTTYEMEIVINGEQD